MSEFSSRVLRSLQMKFYNSFHANKSIGQMNRGINIDFFGRKKKHEFVAQFIYLFNNSQLWKELWNLKRLQDVRSAEQKLFNNEKPER